MSITEYKEEDQELLRTFCIDSIKDPEVAVKDKATLAKLLARMQKLLQKDTEDAGSGQEVVDDTELTDEELGTIKGLVDNGESQ